MTQILPEDKQFVSCGTYTNITFLSLYTACPRSPFTNIHQCFREILLCLQPRCKWSTHSNDTTADTNKSYCNQSVVNCCK